MITPLKTKLHVPGAHSPHYRAGDKIFYNKFHAIEHCRQIGHQWPSYHVWEKSGSFQRPKADFNGSVKRQCELISDTSKHVRLFYSGGRDSNFILHKMLENKSKLDEIAVYRRFPGRRDNTSNEFDQFDLISVTKKTIRQYDADIPIRFYDVLPEHFNFYSKNLDDLFFPYTDLDFFVHGIHTIAEIYPGILDEGFVNVLGHAMPYVNDQNRFYWLDIDSNLTQPDPYTVNFFADPRNTDLAVNLAYEIKNFKKRREYRNMDFTQIGGSNYKNLNEFKTTLNFPSTGTPLDDKYDVLSVRNPNWLLTRKQIVLMANAQTTEMGRQTFDNFVGFYEELSTEYENYFNDGSIYHKWIGSHSELHQLTDE